MRIWSNVFQHALDDLTETLELLRDVQCEKVGPSHLGEYAGRFDEIHARMKGAIQSGPSIAGRAKFLYRNQVSEMLEEAAIIQRNVKKPRGYHGDYETMEMMYRDEFEGVTERGKFIHKMLVGGRECDSVRKRREFLSRRLHQILRKGPPRTILSVASGPAAELRLLPSDVVENLESIVLLDLDNEALSYSLKQLPAHIRKRTNAICGDVVAISQMIPSEFNGMKFDYIYSAGLFDYLPDRCAANLMNDCASLLKADGEMEFGNFAVWPAAFFVDMVCGWQLILRGREELSRLVPSAARVLEFSSVADQIFMRLGV